MNILKLLIFSVLLATMQVANAAAIFSITPSITATTIRSNSSTTVPYTVTNNTNKTLSGITIDPTFNTTANLSISNNTCSILTSGASCQFNLVIPGQNQPSSFTVSPRICAFNQIICSQPILTQRLSVSVVTTNNTIKAFVGAQNGSIYPITLVSGSAGILNAGISGFSLNEPAGIAVNLAGTIVYVTNTGTNQLFAVNINTNQIIHAYNVGLTPAAVVVSNDGSKVYVANYNNGQNNGTISVLNTNTGTLISTISIGNGPWGMAITPDNTKLYVSNSYDNTVSVVSTTNNSLIQTISVGTSPLGIAVTPDGTKVYVANTGSNTVSVINTSNNQVVNTISVGNIPKGVTINPMSTQAYVTNWQDGTVKFIDTATSAITSTVNVGAGPLGIAVSPDGAQLYVTLDQTTAVAVINVNTQTVSYVFMPVPQVTMGNFIG